MGVFGIGVYQPISQLPPGTVPSSIITGGNGGIPGVNTLLYTTAVQNDTPVIFYPMTDLRGPSVTDASGHGYTATIHGNVIPGTMAGPLQGPGETGLTAMTFPGANGSYISMPPFDPSSWGELSINTWVRPTAYIGSPRILANSHTDVDNKGVQLFIQNNGIVTFNLGMGNAQAGAISVTKLPLNKWTMLTATWDGAQILLYVNGQVEGAIAFGGPLVPGASSVFHIGNNPVYTGDNFTGQIALTSFYRGALAPTDILYSYDVAQTSGATLVGSGFVSAPFALAAPGSGIYGGQYGYVVYTTVRGPKVMQSIPAQSIGNDNMGNPVVRGFPQQVWNYSSLRPDYWFYFKWLYKLAGTAPAGYQYLVLLQYPDQSGQNNPVQQLARWDPPTHAYRTVGAYLGVQLKFTYLGQALLDPDTPIVTVTW